MDQFQGNTKTQPIYPPIARPAPSGAKFIASNFRRLDKNTLVGLFDLRLPSDMLLTGCQLLQKGEARWIGLPSSRYVKPDGTLSDHVKVVDFATPQARARFQTLAVAAVEELIAQQGGAQ